MDPVGGGRKEEEKVSSLKGQFGGFCSTVMPICYRLWKVLGGRGSPPQ